MKKSEKDFFEALGMRESGNNYKAVNTVGYIGKYQMGEMAMVDAGYYKPKPISKYNNKWDGEFTGKDGVYNVEDFLNNPIAQENAQRIFKQKQWNYIKHFAKNYNNKEINNIKITPSGMLAAAHLIGQIELEKYLKSNGTYIPKDGYGTSIEEYLQKFGGYDLSQITGIKENDQIKSTEKIIDYANYKNSQISKVKPFTREEIAKMTPEEFAKNENLIMEQMKNNQIKSAEKIIDYENYKNPETGKTRIFTREDIKKMSVDEYSKHEKEINAQLKTIGLPYEKDLPQKTQTYQKEKNKNHSTSSKDGKWVTINGNHVLIEK